MHVVVLASNCSFKRCLLDAQWKPCVCVRKFRRRTSCVLARLGGRPQPASERDSPTTTASTRGGTIFGIQFPIGRTVSIMRSFSVTASTCAPASHAGGLAIVDVVGERSALQLSAPPVSRAITSVRSSSPSKLRGTKGQLELPTDVSASSELSVGHVTVIIPAWVCAAYPAVGAGSGLWSRTRMTEPAHALSGILRRITATTARYLFNRTP